MKIAFNKLLLLVLTLMVCVTGFAAPDPPAPAAPGPPPPPGLPIDSNLMILLIVAILYGIFSINRYKKRAA